MPLADLQLLVRRHEGFAALLQEGDCIWCVQEPFPPPRHAVGFNNPTCGINMNKLKIQAAARPGKTCGRARSQNPGEPTDLGAGGAWDFQSFSVVDTYPHRTLIAICPFPQKPLQTRSRLNSSTNLPLEHVPVEACSIPTRHRSNSLETGPASLEIGQIAPAKLPLESPPCAQTNTTLQGKNQYLTASQTHTGRAGNAERLRFG